MTTTADRDRRQALAQQLLAAADVLGHAVAEVEGLERWDMETVLNEGEAADKVVFDGPEVMRAMKTLAMRLDRAAAVKHRKRGDDV